MRALSGRGMHLQLLKPLSLKPLSPVRISQKGNLTTPFCLLFFQNREASLAVQYLHVPIVLPSVTLTKKG